MTIAVTMSVTVTDLAAEDRHAKTPYLKAYDAHDDAMTLTEDGDSYDRHCENPIETVDSAGDDGDDAHDDKMQNLSKGPFVTTLGDLGDLVAKVREAEVVSLDIETYLRDGTNAAFNLSFIKNHFAYESASVTGFRAARKSSSIRSSRGVSAPG